MCILVLPHARVTCTKCAQSDITVCIVALAGVRSGVGVSAAGNQSLGSTPVKLDKK